MEKVLSILLIVFTVFGLVSCSSESILESTEENEVLGENKMDSSNKEVTLSETD